LDISASMRREGLWPKARALAERYVQDASLLDRVSVVTFDQRPRALFSFSDWSSWPPDQRAAMGRERLEAVSPGWSGTQLGLALTTAAEQFPDDTSRPTASGPRDLALISDLQQGASLEGLQGHDWPKGVRVIIERVDPKRRGNAGLGILDPSAASAGDGRQARVRVVNTRDSDRETFQLGWSAEGAAGYAGKTAQVYLPPGQTRTLSAPELPAGASTGALRLTGDEQEFDNTAYFAASEMERVTVAYFGSESPNDPEHMRYYLQRALPETPRRHVEVVFAVSNSVVSPQVLKAASLAVLPASLPTEAAKDVRDWIAGGNTALLVLTNAQSGPMLAALAGVTDVEISEASGDYALLGEIDFTHPLFAPFADPRFSDFSHIHFWRHRRWTIAPGLAARVLARFDDRAPALAQISIGKGNLLVLAAGWHPADSQLAVSTKFVPLTQIILDWGGGAAPARSQFQTGEPIPPPVSAGDPLVWRKPDGKVVTLAAGTAFTETDLPGIYSVMVGAKPRHFAANPPLDESRTTPLSPDDLASLGVPLGNAPESPAVTPPATQHRLQQEELESRQKLWRWLIVGLLAAAWVEIVLGGWLGRRVRTLEATT